MKKKLISLALALIMVLSLAPASALAEEPKYNGCTLAEWMGDFQSAHTSLSDSIDGGKLTLTSGNLSAFLGVYANRHVFAAIEDTEIAAAATEEQTATVNAWKTLYQETITQLDASGLNSALGGLETLHMLSGLEELNLSGTAISGNNELDPKDIAVWKNTLTKLNLKDTGVTNIDSLKDAVNLTELDLSVTEASETEISINALAFCTKLTALDVSNRKLNSLLPLLTIAEKPDFDASKVTAWTFTGAEVPTSTNEEKALVNRLIARLGEKAVGLTEQDLELADPALASLSVTVGDTAAELTFAADTPEYSVTVSAETQTASITVTAASGCEITKVLWGNETKYDSTDETAGTLDAALKNLDVSTNGVHVQIVVRPENGLTLAPESYRVYVVKLTKAPPPAQGGWLGFGKLEGGFSLFGKRASELGDFEVAMPTEDGDMTVTVTGAAKYVDNYTGFNGAVQDEQKGYYLPIKIVGANGGKVTVKNESDGARGDGKTLTFGADNTLEMAVWLSGNLAASKSAFTVISGEGEASKTYTVDFSRVIFPAQGITVEKESDQSATVSADNVSANLPAEATSGLETPIITVEETTVSTEGITDAAISGALSGEGVKAVEVTIKCGDEEQFTGEDALAGKEITITIGGLTSGTTYYVFCIKTDGVTSYGRVALGSDQTSLSFKTRHLSTFAAVPEPGEEADAKALETAVAAVTREATMVEGGEYVTTPAYAITCETAENGSVTASPTEAAENADVTLTITPDAGYRLDTLTVDGQTVSVTGDTYTFTMPGHAVMVIASFAAQAPTTYAITCETAENGSVTASPTKAAENADVTLTITPDAGYRLDTLTVDGQTVSVTDSTYTFTMPGHAVTVTATFAQTASPSITAAYSEDKTLETMLLGGQIRLENLDGGKYYLCQVTKIVGGAQSSMAFKLHGSTTETLDVLYLASGSYKVELWVCDTDAASLTAYGSSILTRTFGAEG